MFEIFWKTEQKCRKFTDWLTKYVFFNQTAFLGHLLNSIYSICIGNYDTTTWPQSFKIFTPFNTGTISGWYFMWLIQFNVGVAYAICSISITSYFVCCCYYIGAICDRFDFHIKSVEKCAELLLKITNPVEYGKIFERIKSNISQAIETHVQVFQIFNMVEQINSGSIFALLPLTATFVAITGYNVEHVNYAYI